jgi:phosphohistidine phosphatase
MHAEVFQDLIEEFRKTLGNFRIKGKKTDEMNLMEAVEFKCKGGGRIAHSDTEGKILVYGYSQQYGRCEHKKTVKLLKQQFSDYPQSTITWTNDGY